MPRGYRCIVIAALGWLILAASPPKDSAQPENQRATQSAQQSLQDIASALKSANEPKEPDPGCEAGQDNRKSDLCAQWKAADAAVEGVTWTRRGFWIGLGGLVIGAFTLAAAGFAAWYARKAWIEAKRGADAAEDAVAETSRIGEAQTRAYLSITSLSGQLYKHGLVFRAMVANSGQSPALETTITFHVVMPDGTRHESEPMPPLAVPAAAERPMAYWYYKNPEARAWTGVAVFVILVYRDVFGSTNGANETFAGSPDRWNFDDFTDLAEGRHVRSYLESMGEDMKPYRSRKNYRHAFRSFVGAALRSAMSPFARRSPR